MKRKIYITLISASIIITGVLGLVWLSIPFFIVLGFYFLFSSKIKFIQWLRKKRFITVTSFSIGLFILTIGIRLLFFEVFAIPGGSMEDTLLPGDKVLVSKLNYGPRMPNSPFQIPWVNLLCYYNAEARSKIDSVWWDYKRLDGYTNIERQDILVFNFPDDEKIFFVKRCIGLPNDNISITNGSVFVNGERECAAPTSKVTCRVWYTHRKCFRQVVDSINVSSYCRWSRADEKYADLILTFKQRKLLNDYSCIDSLKIKTTDDHLHCFPWCKQYPWTIDNFGSLTVPQKGMTIQLNSRNFDLYKKVLRKFENFKPKRKDGHFLINGEEVKEYTFKQDYYFMMGDNRHNSQDSRFWGFVPKDHIVGKTVCVLFSNSEEGINWNRIFKAIH